MKLHFVLATIVIFCDLKVFSQGSRENAVFKAFVNISGDLTKRNRVVSLVLGEGTKYQTDSAIFKATAGTPHVVARFDSKIKHFTLNSTAIVSVTSLESLKIFSTTAQFCL